MTRLAARLRNLKDYAHEFGVRGAFEAAVGVRRGGPFEVHVRGFAESFNCRDSGSDFSMLREVIGRRSLQLTLRRLPGLIVDAGANVGFATRVFMQQFPNSRIIALEPDEENCNAFRKNVRGNNVDLLNMALWSHSRGVRIANPGDHACSLRVEDAKPNVFVVPSITMDEIVRKFGDVSILKLDIEGAEKEVFASGAQPWVERVGLIMVELHERYAPGVGKLVESVLGPLSKTVTCRGHYKLFDLKGLA